MEAKKDAAGSSPHTAQAFGHDQFPIESEASGTSGMKAAQKGGAAAFWMTVGSRERRAGAYALALQNKLGRVVMPMFYRNRDRFSDVMRQCISLNGSCFNMQRTVSPHVIKAALE